MSEATSGTSGSAYRCAHAGYGPTKLRAAPCRGRHHRQHLGARAIRRVLLPAHRAERTLQHAADPHRLGAVVEADGLLVQGALVAGGAVALAQIVEPGRAVIALGP